jgi:hypothetical protein
VGGWIMKIDPKNHKILNYLFKRNKNNNSIYNEENLFDVMQKLFEDSKIILISTPYIQNTSLFKITPPRTMADELSDLLKIDVMKLQNKLIFILTSNKDFEAFVKDAGSPNAFANKN